MTLQLPPSFPPPFTPLLPLLRRAFPAPAALPSSHPASALLPTTAVLLSPSPSPLPPRIDRLQHSPILILHLGSAAAGQELQTLISAQFPLEPITVLAVPALATIPGVLRAVADADAPAVPTPARPAELVGMMGVGGRGLGGHEALVVMEEFGGLREVVAGVREGGLRRVLGERAGAEVEMWWREEWVGEGGA